MTESVQPYMDMGEGESMAMTANAVLPIEVAPLAEGFYKRAVSVTIASDQEYAEAAKFIVDIKSALKTMDEDRVKLKAPFLAGTRQIDDYFRAPMTRGEQAIAKVKAAMVQWDTQKSLARQAEQRRLDDERRKAEAEAREREKAAQEQLRAEEQAKREAAEAREREERTRREAAEAQERRERARREAADAQAKGLADAAAQANARAKAAEEEAAAAREQAKIDREKAIEARRAQLKAEAASQAAIAHMDQAHDAVQTASTATVTTDLAKVDGVSRRKVWKWRLTAPIDKVPMIYHTIDAEKLDSVVKKLGELAGETLGSWVEVFCEDTLSVGKKRGTER